MRLHFLPALSLCLAVSAQAQPVAIHLLSAPTSTPAEARAPASWPIPAELLGGVIGETLLFAPGGYAGFLAGPSFASTAGCDSIADQRHRGECIELIQTDARASGLLAGVSLGLGLGAGLGVSVAGMVMGAGGHPWWSMGLGLLGGASGLLVPLVAGADRAGTTQLAGLVVSSVLGLTGAMLGYQIGAPAPATLSRSVPVLIPTLKVGPGGGSVGVTGRF